MLPPSPKHSFRIIGEARTVRMVPTNWADYEAWIDGIQLLLEKSEPAHKVVGEFGRPGIGLKFLDEVKTRQVPGIKVAAFQ